ncbi:MAG: tRNA (guanosine(46)-N7)-methyltransferase TrmB [Gammaproteobacteria bacterium]|nr:tRNA (guanosine(46)-N7)-methyltransferase TrmB [Gammaproteobacteria bacterium]
MSDIIRRTVKSFILRQGRLTQGQQRALAQQWPLFGIDFTPQPLDFNSLFGNQQPVILEIGFGNGDSLAQMARENPQQNFIGIEVHRPGVGHLLHLIQQYEITNLRVMNHDAIDILHQQIAENSLSRVQLYFPDPWHKTKHNKRRIVQPAFLDRLAQLLNKDGQIHFATDWHDYAKHMMKTLENHPQFSNQAGNFEFSPKPDYRPTTKFERRGQKLGHGVWDLIFSVNKD